MAQSKKKGNVKRKISRAQYSVERMRAMKDPAKRKQILFVEKISKLSLDYLELVEEQGNITAYLEENASDVEEIGGLESIHGFLLVTLGAIESDYDEDLTEEGYLNRISITQEGAEGIEQHKEDKERLAAKA